MQPGPVLSKLTVSALMLTAAGIAQAQLYWRVDLGYSAATDAEIKDVNFAADQFICGNPACTVPGQLNDIGSAFVIGGGVGSRVNPNLRVDGTLTYRTGYKLNDSDSFPSNFQADITSWSLMANGYYDFNLTWGKPYLGAGIGFALNKIDSIVNTGGALGTASITVPGGTNVRLAWALMAGVGIPVSPTLTLDIFYRYTDLGDIASDSGVASCAPVACPGAMYSGAKGKLRANELMIGLRF